MNFDQASSQIFSPGETQLEQLVAAVEVLRPDDRRGEMRRNETVRHGRVGVEAVLRRLVAEPAVVLDRVRRVEQVVDERVGEHGPLGAAHHRDRIAADHPAAVGRVPVADVLDRLTLGQVVLGVDHVARPRLVHPRALLGQHRVGLGPELHG